MHQMVPQECSDRIRKHVQIKDKHAPNEEEQASNAKPAPNGEEDAANDVHVNGSQPSVERALSQWVFKYGCLLHSSRAACLKVFVL